MSLRGKSEAKDAAIHRVLRKKDGFVSSLTGPSGSPRAFSPRDDKVGSDGSVRFGYNTILSLRGGSVASDVAIHWMQWSRRENAVRSLAQSGSPRAFALAMTRWWN
ncbi:hypothetical protein OAV71_05365 [Opitutales bacterium]|nr:hypothetical protein [Opitutales bacterium]